MKKFLRGFVYAAKGIAFALTQRNFRFHLCAAVFVTLFAIGFYDLSRAEWAVLLLTMGLVISLEAANTAIEQLADKVCAKQDDKIKHCKDCAASAVLIAAIAAVAVGISLFLDTQRLYAAWEFFTADFVRPAVLAAAVGLAAAFVLLPDKMKK